MPASLVAEHLRVLATSRTLKAIAAEAGMDRHTVSAILSGRTRRVRAANAQVLLAVEVPGDLDPQVAVEPTPTVQVLRAVCSDRRLDARQIADLTDLSPTTIRRVLTLRNGPVRPLRVRAWVDDRLETLCDELSSAPRRPSEAPPCPRVQLALNDRTVRGAVEQAAAGTLTPERRRAAVALLARYGVGASRAAKLLLVCERTVWRDRAASQETAAA